MQKKLEKIFLADSLWQKTWGVMFWADFRGYDGMLLTKTNGIHTFFVRFPLDLVFLDKNYKVVQLIEDLKPFRISPIIFRAKHTLELPAGGIKKHSIKIDDSVDLL